MTRYVYPRLPMAATQSRMLEVTETYRAGGLDALRRIIQFDHEQAAPVATGGTVASRDQVQTVRAQVVASVQTWLDNAATGIRDLADFDLVLGRSLHEHLQIVPADAAHDET